jgi:hypothetical protein
MQLNLYVPKDRVGVVRALERAARASGRGKNLMALDAIEKYLDGQAAMEAPLRVRTWRLGTIKPWARAELYEERIDHVLGLDEARVAEGPAQYDPDR